MMMKEEDIKEHLMSADPQFRRLCEEHQQHEGRLNELRNRHHMKKLQLKDQMNSMISKFRNELSHQHT